MILEGGGGSYERGTPVYFEIYIRGGTQSVGYRGLDVIRKEAWPFYRTSSGARLCWELEEPKGPKGGDQVKERGWDEEAAWCRGSVPIPGVLECKDTHRP